MAKNGKNGGLGIADVTTANLDEKLKSTNTMDQEVLEMATANLEKEEKDNG